MQPNDLTSADIGCGHEGNDNNIGSLPPSNRSSKKLKKATATKFRVSPYRIKKQSIQHHESLDFGPGHAGGGSDITLGHMNTSLVLNGRMVDNSCQKISTRISEETKTLSHSVDKMNLHSIDRLVDIIGQLQRSKTYQLLSNAIQSQTVTSNVQDKRAAETKLLLCNIVHEQAKLQLMHVKRERLLKNVQAVVSGIQESEALKLNHIAQKSLAAQLIHSDTIKSVQECQVENDKVTSMREEIKDIDGRISNLTKSFHISTKMKGEHTPADTITLVNDHLMEKARHQIIRKDVQVLHILYLLVFSIIRNNIV
nr:hypothetical protein [Tanacetum cinerariifolium]